MKLVLNIHQYPRSNEVLSVQYCAKVMSHSTFLYIFLGKREIMLHLHGDLVCTYSSN